MKIFTLFKKIVVAITCPDNKLDLFQVFPDLYSLFKNQKLHFYWQRLLFILLALLILMGLFGSQNPDLNSMLFISWGLWWPSVVLSWFFVGRMWCGFCPFPLAGSLLQNFGFSLKLKIPKWLEKNSIEISTAFLCLIIWAEEGSGMKESPMATAILLLTILLGATISAIIFRQQTWCRYICPLGRMIAVGSSISLMEFRADHQKCKTCKNYACRRGNEEKEGCPVFLGAAFVTNNLDCLVCGKCMSLCNNHAPQLNLRVPLEEIVIRKGKFITCSYIIPFLMSSQLVRFLEQSLLPIMGSINGACLAVWHCQMGLWLVLLIFAFFIIYATINYGDILFGVYHDDLLGRFSPMVPMLFPIAFAGELVNRIVYTLRHFSDFLPTVGRQLGLNFLEQWTFTFPEWIYPVISLPCIFLGQLGAFYVLEKFKKIEFEGMIASWRYHGIQLGFLLLFMLYISLMSMGWDLKYLNILYLLKLDTSFTL